MTEDTRPAYDQPDDDPDVLFHANGPINPVFVIESVRTLMRALPLNERAESEGWRYRRMFSAMRALAALHPRDEIELMLGIQTLSAYHAASACWRLGMNLKYPAGDSTRHITTAASAARTFDSLLKALERRQAKPLVPPTGRPAPRVWPKQDPTATVASFEQHCREDEAGPEPAIIWAPETIALANDLAEQDRIADENHGLDLANTEGILPDGSIIMPECPTPQQDAYIARRVALRMKREWAENKRKGIRELPRIRPLRTGDRVE